MKGFKNFLMRGDVVVIAIGLVVALAFSNLIKAFTDFIILPIVARAQGAAPGTQGLGWQLGAAGNKATFLDLGQLISAIIYFLIFMAVVYFVIVLPYKHIQARRGIKVFGDPAPAQTCPSCLSDDLPLGATKCKYCTADIPAVPQPQ
ncbi:MscL family protein [Microlunatus elymi]|uniref:MscL family protein n=1 Tax=Microlunatus elymi TaxID=2596828 RepID=A0A516Q097_9ACTN|nr:MscL family protein [Microlunatus elymi]QDP96856.1 MscL family protein [Microlunatus elymi]